MPRLILPAVALALALAAPASAAENVTELDRFKLWNSCKPMRLVVERLDRDATAIGLTRRDLTVAARSRLRAARLYSTDYERAAWSRLYINVTVVETAFSIAIGYGKNVLDLATADVGNADTWDHGATGTHRRNSSYILSGLSRLIDTFIDEYLRVNRDACQKLPPAR